MNKEYGVSWNLVYDTLKSYYYAFDESTQHAFNKFYEPLHFFAIASPTNGIPLSLGRSTSNSKYEVIMEMHIYEQLVDFIQQQIPSIPSPPLAGISPQEYEIIESFEASQSNMLSKYQQKAKKKNKQREKLCAARKEASLAGMLVNDKRYVFISLDIEAYELDHSILLEIGWSMFDSKSGLFMDQHYIMDNYRHLKNGKFVDDQREKFMFGTSVWCSLKQALIELRKDLDWAVERDGGFVLVGHGLDSDLKYLRQQKFLWPTVDGQDAPTVEESAKITIFNTDTIYAASIDDLHNPPSLGKTLNLLGVETWCLHNAGNDAHYTLLLLLKLVSDKKNMF